MHEDWLHQTAYSRKKPLARIYNSCLLIGSNGESIGNARKRYLWGREKRIFTPGDSYEVFRTELGAIAPLLCYDLEFPEPARIAMLKGADLIAAGVKPGKELGEILQAMLEWVLEDPGKNDKDELLRQLKERS